MKLILAIFWCSACLLLAGEKFDVGEFKFEASDAWKKGRTNRMVKAAFTHGEGGPLVKFYHFGRGQGGGVAANIRRWKGQFQGESEMKQDSKKYGDQEVATVEISGTYLDGPPMGKKTPKEGFILLGAVIPHKGGDVFIKMTGPKAEMEKARVAFHALVKSAFTEAAAEKE